jgi:hypothetical protein
MLSQILYVPCGSYTVKPVLSTRVDKYNEPDQVNQYTITGKTLGRGAQGTVKLAKDGNQSYVISI